MTQADSPRVLTTEEELDALFTGSLIEDASGEEWFKVGKSEWVCIHGDRHYSDLIILDADAPLVLIYQPEKERKTEREEEFLALVNAISPETSAQ